ncbi:protein kinase [Tothia fuscella]|uniref:Protein kinase n=1 Tax=Tothia fuscella TaxID=1048955 RepID=A0A9P4NSM9_9PEZI|nr:protein kinase [Tothia fuscella]
MDFLKSAVASAISKGPAFPYSFDDRVEIDKSIWTLHNSTKREDGSKCSVFSFDIAANKSRLPLARNSLRKLRTLRHPGVIKVLDTVETETVIYIATERLVPLSWHIKRKSLSQETVKWGLCGIAKTIKFINGDATSIHGSVRASYVFTSESGEWKLAGFDILSSIKDDDAIIYNYGSLVPDSARYAPPEVTKTGWEAIKRNPISAFDAYSFGIFVYEVFNGGFVGTDQLSQPKGVPPTMQQSYKRLINANPKSRISAGQFLEQGQRSGGFFETPLIHLTEGIDNLGLKSDGEREEFLRRSQQYSQLDAVSDDFPEDFFKMKVLPELLKSVEFGGGGPKVLGVVFKIGAKLSDEEYEHKITPVVIRLFSNQDRALRVCLLDNLPVMIDRLSQKTVTNSIFPQMVGFVTGFSDAAPLVREQTVKSVLTIISKLSDRAINGELLRHLAKTSNDEQPGIRTNTTICLGKIARNLGAASRTKVLTAAFARSLRDPFVHARNAGLLALAATVDLFSEDDCASKILPGICTSLIDKEKLVRDQANKTLDIYLQRVRKHALSLPDTILPPAGAPANSASASVPRMETTQAGASWAGWAISSFTNKLATASGQMDVPANVESSNASSDLRSNSVPPVITSAPQSTAPVVARGLQPQVNANKMQSANPFAPSDALQADDDDFDTGWADTGGGWDDEASAADPFAAPSVLEPRTTDKATFDDQGEPDFAGWIAAQSKQKSKNLLPKGLVKKAANGDRPGLGVKANSTGNPVTKRTEAKPKVVPKVVTKSKVNEDEEDDAAWGEAW